MPYTMEDYQRDYALEHLSKLPPEDVLKKFSIEDRLKGLSKKDSRKLLEELQNLDL